MKIFLCFFIIIFVSNFSLANPNKNDLYSVEDTLKITKNNTLKELFAKGIEEYSKYKYNNAIVIWKEVLQKAAVKKDSSLILKTNINIGSSYNALGYHKTAVNYFLSSNKIFSDYNLKNESYWVNYINIGVCYMSLEQYDLAKNYFDKTLDFNKYIVFLKKLNLAKWHVLQNQQDAFLKYQKEIELIINEFPMYIDVWNEMQLNFFIKSNNITKTNEVLAKLIPDYNKQNLYIKLLINQGNLLVNNKIFENVKELLLYAPEVSSSNDLYLTELYYLVLKEHFYNSNNIDKLYYYTDLLSKNNEALFKERNMLYVEDFKSAQELETFKNQFSKAKLKTKLIENQLSESRIKFKFSIIVIIMVIGIIFLIIRNYNKTKKIQKLILLESQNELLKKEVEKIELSNSLDAAKNELNSSILTIKKIALLKKQLSNIVDENREDYNEKETLKKLKLSLNSFFDNYRELNDLIHKKLNVDETISETKKEFSLITEKELKVIEYIILQFTTKEISLLMDKSEKSIEYYRTQIRKKIKLEANSKLEERFARLI